MTPVECSLEMMLAARDARRECQSAHFAAHPELTLLVATVVAPGKYKLTDRTAIVAAAEREALHRCFGPYIQDELSLDLPSGHETWLSLSFPLLEAKMLACEIEDTHHLGRLFDIDIINPSLAPVSRTELNVKPRKCLLCDNDARLCMRAHTHTPEEVEARIASLIDSFPTS